MADEKDEDKDRVAPDRGDDAGTDSTSVLVGTTLKVYRFLYKEARPLNIHEVQRGLGMSSASLAQYHIKKLVQAGLVREQDEGYAVDRIFFENFIRIGRSTIPFQIAYAVFFATMLGFLAILWRVDDNANSLLVFGFTVTLFGLGIFLYESIKTMMRSG